MSSRHGFDANLLPPFIAIPATPFLMGTPERELSALAKAYGGTRESYREEAPQHTLALSAFAIAQVPVTNALYAAFVTATGARAPIGWHGTQPPGTLRDHPLVDVSWEDANAFCAWLNTQIADCRLQIADYQQQAPILALSEANGPNLQSPIVRLPTEAEWECAARGGDGRRFPWGGEWDASRANTRDGGPGGTTAAGSYASGASPYGCLDMAGNAWEWTASLDMPYPYVPTDGREDPRTAGRRILRGGCYANPHGFARCTCRFRLPPAVRNDFLGFRLALSYHPWVRG